MERREIATSGIIQWEAAQERSEHYALLKRLWLTTVNCYSGHKVYVWQTKKMGTFIKYIPPCQGEQMRGHSSGQRPALILYPF
jgi:hypothetical protein